MAEIETADSLDPRLLSCCSVSLHLTRRNISKLLSDLLDLCLEGFHGTLDGYKGCVLLKETLDSLSLSFNISFALLDSLVQRLEFAVDWNSSACDRNFVCKTATYTLFPWSYTQPQLI